MSLYLFLFSLLLCDINTDLKQVVKEYHELTGEESQLSFIKKYHKSTDPSVQGYVTSISMKQAEYSFNPFLKLKLFEKNKNKLNSLIENNITNIHLRYVRLLIQENIPFFLSYHDSINEDKLILQNILEVKDETDYLDEFIRKHTSL